MQTITVEFSVAMDSEQKRLNNVKKVKFECSFDGVATDVIQRHAIANMVVQWQGQIRGHWTEFVNGELPKTVVFGQPLFNSGRRATVRPMTEDEKKDFIRKEIVRMRDEGKSDEEIMSQLMG